MGHGPQNMDFVLYWYSKGTNFIKTPNNRGSTSDSGVIPQMPGHSVG